MYMSYVLDFRERGRLTSMYDSLIKHETFEENTITFCAILYQTLQKAFE